MRTLTNRPLPVAMTKPSACSCCHIIHSAFKWTECRASPQSRVGIEVAKDQRLQKARVTLCVTKVGPRRGRSWLKRMPLDAGMPKASR